ncbi:MAG: hypothetical protein RIF33_00905 [Cyclobacteriaceae bacterium]
MKRIIYSFILVAIFQIGCDSANEDAVPSVLAIDFFTYQNAPVITSPSQFFVESSEPPEINGRPSKGVVEMIGESNALRYLPNVDFVSGADRYSIRLVDTEGKRYDAVINVLMLDSGSCAKNGVYEYVTVSQGQSIERDLLVNDYFCGLTASLSRVTLSFEDIYVDDSFGENEVFLSIGPNGLDLKYTAPEDASGRMDLVYQVGVGHGLINQPVFLDDQNINPAAYQQFITAQVTIEIID